MLVPRPRRAALLVCVLFLAAELFAFAPLLHAHCSLLAGSVGSVGSVGSAAGTAAGSSGPLRGAAPASPAQDECPACRIASLVMVAQGRPPLILPLPRLAEAAGAPTERRCWLTLDRACGRAPPRC
ncbi:MAG TPA: hypothetical protein VJA16_10740 [Thermoanaerobaculia bacterium]